MFRKQLRTYSLALFTVLICWTSAYSQSIGLTHSNTRFDTTIGIGSNASVVLFSEGTNSLAVDSLELSIRPPLLQPIGVPLVDVPEITNVSGLGIFDGATTSFSFTPTSPSASFNAEAVLSIPDSTEFIDNAPVAEFFFDTSGLSVGDTFVYAFDGEFLNGDQRLETIVAGIYTATVVPEPSSAALMLALGSVAMLRRKRAC